MKTDYSIYILSKEEKVKYYVCSSLISLSIVFLIYDNLFFMIIFIPAIIFLRKFYQNMMANKKKKSLLLEFKDFLYLISTSFSLGRNMKQAMEEAISGLITVYGADSIMVSELKEIVREMDEFNGNEQELLMDFAGRTHLEDVMDFVQVYDSCKTTGGDIIYAVNSAANIIADKIAVEQEIKAATSQRKLEGRMISLMPFLIILFLKVTSPDYLSVMYESFAGRMIMSGGLVMVGIALYLVERITKVEL